MACLPTSWTKKEEKKRSVFQSAAFFLCGKAPLVWLLRRPKKEVVLLAKCVFLLHGPVIATHVSPHATWHSPSQTGLLGTWGCWSHFSAPPPGPRLYCGGRRTHAWFRWASDGHVCVCARVFAGFYHSESSALSSALSSSPSRITSLRATWDNNQYKSLDSKHNRIRKEKRPD